MPSNTLTYTMIQSAINRGLEEISQDVERGVRNLVDLGAMFSKGRYQRGFFKTAQDELLRDGSVFFSIARDLVNHVDRRILKGFCINLGYGSWAAGARHIRSIEEKEGFNVPWTFILSCEADTSAADVSERFPALFAQGKELGAYSYMLQIHARFPALDALFGVLSEHTDCAFVLFFEDPAALADDAVRRIFALSNLFVSVNLDAAGARHAIERLRALRCLFGGYHTYSVKSPSFDARAALENAAGFGVPILFFVQKDPDAFSLERSFCIDSLRARQDVPVYPFDLLPDIARADRNISSEACVAFIAGNGEMTLVNADTGAVSSGYSVNSSPLWDILRAALPKRV